MQMFTRQGQFAAYFLTLGFQDSRDIPVTPVCVTMKSWFFCINRSLIIIWLIFFFFRQARITTEVPFLQHTYIFPLILLMVNQLLFISLQIAWTSSCSKMPMMLTRMARTKSNFSSRISWASSRASTWTKRAMSWPLSACGRSCY